MEEFLFDYIDSLKLKKEKRFLILRINFCKIPEFILVEDKNLFINDLLIKIKDLRYKYCISQDLRNRDGAVYKNFIDNKIYQICNIISHKDRINIIKGTYDFDKLILTSYKDIIKFNDDEKKNKTGIICSECDNDNLKIIKKNEFEYFNCDNCFNFWLNLEI